MSIARTSTIGGALDVLAPITSRASGRVAVDYHAADRHTRFTAPINSTHGRIRFQRRLPAAQARLATGIVTIAYTARTGRSTFDVHDILDNGEDKVVVLLTETAQRNDKSLSISAVHVWGVQEAKATRFQAFVADEYELDEFWS